MEGAITFWVIYDHPKDYPDEFVGRRQFVTAAGIVKDNDLFARGPSVAAVREQIPQGAIQVGPSPGDDPVIAEVWM